MNLLTLIKTYWVGLTIALLCLITLFSLWPLAFLPPVPGSDKTHHLIAYALLMLPVALRQPKHWLCIALGFVLYSGLIELIQPYVNRYGEWLDLLANTVGIFAGLLLGQLINYFSAAR